MVSWKTRRFIWAYKFRSRLRRILRPLARHTYFYYLCRECKAPASVHVNKRHLQDTVDLESQTGMVCANCTTT